MSCPFLLHFGPFPPRSVNLGIHRHQIDPAARAIELIPNNMPAVVGTQPAIANANVSLRSGIAITQRIAIGIPVFGFEFAFNRHHPPLGVGLVSVAIDFIFMVWQESIGFFNMYALLFLIGLAGFL